MALKAPGILIFTLPAYPKWEKREPEPAFA